MPFSGNIVDTQNTTGNPKQIDKQLTPEVMAIHIVLINQNHIRVNSIFRMTRSKLAWFWGK